MDSDFTSSFSMSDFTDASSDYLEESSDEDAYSSDTYSDSEDSPNMDTSAKYFVDPLAHVSHVYFYLNRSAYELMIKALQGDSSIMLEDLKACNPLLDLKKWRRLKDEMFLKTAKDNCIFIFLKDKFNQRISYIEDWESIVQSTHCVRKVLLLIIM